MLSMRWATVLLIFQREVRDQLRDRRTIFMIFVLPVMLYPMLGLLTAQLSTAFTLKPRSVVVVGTEQLPPEPPLLNAARDRFAKEVLDSPDQSNLFQVLSVPAQPPWTDAQHRTKVLREGLFDLVLILPQNLPEQIQDEKGPVQPELVFDSGDDDSLETARSVREFLARWNGAIVGKRLQRDQKTDSYLQPVQPKSQDVARVQNAASNVWSRMFPFLLVMMSLTGAFYPAVDLCAGEKERGTMETLLITPASRAEIVTGKFLTVMLASVATALVNLASMGLTAWQLTSQVSKPGAGTAARSTLAMPEFSQIFWMILLLIPLAAFFSALCVAMAAMARSMKEGQYYLTPIYIVAIPLVFATLTPGIELNLFTSLVPITGPSLLLRSLMQGKYAEARQFFLPVLLPLVIYALLALRWAVEQFRKESVLFREAERFNLQAWLRHLVRDRTPTPPPAAALLCFALMLCSAWFSMGSGSAHWSALLRGQILYILLPPLLLTLLFTSSPRQTLLLNLPSFRYLALAIALALTLNPLVAELRLIVDQLFPIPDLLKQQLAGFMEKLPNIPTAIFALALVPAVCEEVAFRGYILQGLRSGFRTSSSILLSAFLFGFLHVLLSLFQQLFNATLLGIVLGLLAVRSRSLLPGILFHFTNNALAVLLGAAAAAPEVAAYSPWLFRDTTQGLYHRPLLALSTLLSLALVATLLRGPHQEMDGSPQPETPPAN